MAGEDAHAGEAPRFGFSPSQLVEQMVVQLEQPLHRQVCTWLAPRRYLRADPHDLVQATIAKLLAYRKQQPQSSCDRTAVWAAMKTIAWRQLLDLQDRYTRQRLHIGVQVPLREPILKDMAQKLSSRQLTPEQRATANELLERCLGHLNKAQQRVLLLGMDGLSDGQIAATLNCSPRNVRRLRYGVRVVVHRLSDGSHALDSTSRQADADTRRNQ